MTKSLKPLMAFVMFLAAAAALQAAPHAPLDLQDLCELSPGETRDYGEGDHLVTASRVGDTITVTLPAHDGDAPKTIDFDVADGKCPRLAMDIGHGRKMIMLRNDGGSDGGPCCDEEHFSFVHEGLGEDAMVKTIVVTRSGAEQVESDVIVSGLKEGLHDIFVTLNDSDDVTLRCPEGDTTMTVAKDEAEIIFQCPRHHLTLEKVSKQQSHVKVLRIVEEDEEE